MAMTIDTSEVRALAADMRQVHSRLSQHVRPVIAKGALNIRDDLRAKMAASGSFGHLARGITYDLEHTSGAYEAEIGPAKKHTGERKAPRRGANIAYFGTSKGGGTVEDPAGALEREAPRFADALADLAAELVFGP